MRRFLMETERGRIIEGTVFSDGTTVLNGGPFQACTWTSFEAWQQSFPLEIPRWLDTDEVQDYLDEETGIHLSIEQDHPTWPRIALYPSPQMDALSLEAINAAIKRLIEHAQQEGTWPPPPSSSLS